MNTRMIDQKTAAADFLVRMWDNSYCASSATLVNLTAAEQKLIGKVGYPVKASGNDWVVVLATDEANAEAFLIESESITLAPTGDARGNDRSRRPATGLVSGPATVRAEGIAKTDPAGTDYDQTALKAVLAGFTVPVVIKDTSANLKLQAIHDGPLPGE